MQNNKPTYEELEKHLKEAEEKIRLMAVDNSENCRYKTFFEQSHDGIITIDPETLAFLEFNDQVCYQLGFTREEFAHLTIFDIEALETAEETRNRIDSVLSRGKMEFETRQKTKRGDIIDVNVIAQIIEASGKKIYHCIWRDITEIKRFQREMISAREKAEEIQRKLKETQAMAKLGGWELDIETGMFTFTDNLLEIYHTNAEEIGGYHINIYDYASKFVHPDDAEMVAQENMKAIDTSDPGFSNYVEHRIKYFDGGIGYIAVRYFIKKDENGRTIKAFGVNQDITEKKLTEQRLIAAKEKAEKDEKALKHSHDLMQYIIEHNRSAIAVHDKNFRYIYVSQRYLQEYKVKEKDIIGKHHYDVFPDLPQKWREVHKKALMGEVSSAEDDPYYKDDGTVEWTRWECRPWYENDNSIGGFIIYTEVTTQRKQLELDLQKAKEKAEENDKLKTAFLLNMSHEIKTPLNSIIGYSEMLNKPDLSEEKRKNFTSVIISSSQRLESIVNNILTVSVLETRQEKINIQPVNVNLVISELFSIYKSKAAEQKIGLFLNYQQNDIISEINTDGTKLSQIITNLLNNAFKFTSEGKIEFGYELKGNEIEFFVKDTGIGIDSDWQEKVFERFVQVETGLVRKYGGNGLGLAISKGYVELLGGKIWLESEINKGTSFYFTIPYYPVQEEIKTQPEMPLESKSATILVAEDEEFNYFYIEELLSDMNFVLIHATNGREAVEHCANNQNINLVLMDIKMPVMDGFTATLKIKESRPGLPVIAQSAYSLEQYTAKYNHNPFDDYISKPINGDLLVKKMLRFLTK